MRLPLIGPTLYVTATLILGVACSQSDPAPGEPSPGNGSTEAPAPPTPVVPEAEGPTVAFLGDSIAAGLHLPASQAFPAVLERRLREAGAPFHLVNSGISGDTTSGGLRRIDWILGQSPAIVVLELGGNDGLRGIELETIESNLRAMVDKARAADAEVLLLGHVLPPNYGEDYTGGFAAIFDRVAEEYELPYVPFFLEGVGGVPELNLPDGLHPTAEGHEKLADRIAPALEPLVRAATVEPDPAR